MVYPTNVSHADVSDPDDLLAEVATWPADRQDDFHERQAIMEVDARMPYVAAVRQAYKDLHRWMALVDRPHSV